MNRRSGRRRGGVPWRAIPPQSRAQASALVVTLVVLVVTAFLASALPRAATLVAGQEVRAAVADKNHTTDVVVNVPLRGTQGEGFELALDTADLVTRSQARVETGLPADTRSVLGDPVGALIGPELKAGSIDGRPGRVRFAYVVSAEGPAIEWVEGRAPAATGDASDLLTLNGASLPIEVGVSAAAAELMGVHAGDRIDVEDTDGSPLDVTVTGIFRAINADDFAWDVVPRLLEPTVIDGGFPLASIALWCSPESVPFARLAVFQQGMQLTFTYPANAEAFTAANAPSIAADLRGLASGKQVFDFDYAPPTVRTGLDRALDGALARTEAATTQAFVVLLALLSAVVLVEVMAASLVVERRATVLAQWRSRGASLPAVGAAIATESAAVTVLGGSIGLAAAYAAVPGTVPWIWVVPPLVLAGLAGPVLSVRAAGRSAAPPPAGRRAQGRLDPRSLRRITAEVTLILSAAASLGTLALRGVSASEGSVAVDAMILGAPVLGTLAVAVLLVRLLSPLTRAARALARRSRGAVTLLAAARARSGATATVSLVLAASVVAITTSGALTVDRGQDTAAWETVGADAIAVAAPSGPFTVGVQEFGAGSGLRVAGAQVISNGQLIGAHTDKPVRVLAVDSEALASLVGESPLSPLTGLPGLVAGGDPGQPLPILVSLPGADADLTLRWGQLTVPVTPVGAAPLVPGVGESDRITVIVDRAALAEAVDTDLPQTVVWASGPNAGPALQQVFGSEGTVTVRSAWLAERRASPVARGLFVLFAGAAGVSLMLALLAVSLIAAAGGDQRDRSSGGYRVVGMSRASAALVARAEVAVPAGFATAVGLATGLALSGILAVPFGFNSTTGERVAPHAAVPWWALAVPPLLALAGWVAVALASLSRRRENLGQIMRG